MKTSLTLLVLALPLSALAHSISDVPMKDGKPLYTEALRQHIADEWMAKRMALAHPDHKAESKPLLTKPVQTASLITDLSMLVTGATLAPAGNGALMQASFGAFKPGVRIYNDANYFYVESDSMPDPILMPTPMVGITSWQQQLPHPVGYFGNITNPESDTGSLGYGQPNVWRIPLVAVAAASPISLTGNFLRGAVALGANGIPIFNPRNNTGQFSQAIGELDAYGGHCGRADDYHYHIAPTHLYSVLTPDKPCAWALDGYPIYGYTEPDGTSAQATLVNGGHTHGTLGYHYHARGTYNSGTGTWTPSSPYLMDEMHGAVVNYGGQIDPQPTASTVAPAGAPLGGAVITGFTRTGTDSWTMTYTVSGTTYTVTAAVDRIAHTVRVSQQTPTDPTGTPATYTSTARFNYYPMAPWSMARLPDTGQTSSATATFGEDHDYTINAPSFTDNGNGTVTDNNTGLMWQKTDSGEMIWDNARTGATSLNLAGYTDWRLPTAQEAFCILNHERNPALDPTYFANNASGTPGYFWTSDLFYGDNTKVWCTNTGGGIGPHNKTATISAGGTNRHHARYVRGTKPTTGHHYVNNNDGTVSDLDTNLMWTQVPSSAMSWSSALTYAEGLTTAGYSDWRLPNVKELQSLQDIPRATASAATTNPCLNKTLFPSATATAYWSSTSVKAGTLTQAWLVDFGVTTTSTPSRNQQGIVSYEPYASTYPVFAVRSAAVQRSISQGLATTTTANLLPAGQRVSGVGLSTANDGTTWVVPAATKFTTAAKAPDLYNDVTAVTPANITAAQTAINSAPTVVVDADGEVITGYIFADNYFELYVNGTLVGVDPVPYTPFNSCFVKFKAKKPITYAIKLVDWEENLGVGSELNGGNSYHPGDGGLFASFSDGTVTNSQWKAQSFYIAPLNDPALVIEQANGTHDSSAAGLQTPTLNQNSYALHYTVPSNWFARTFSDAAWPNATTYTEAQVGVTGKLAYTNFPGQFTNTGGSFIWSSNLVLDNEVIVRYTGPASVQQIGVEQPSGTTLTDGSSTVAYGSVNVGSSLSKTFTIKNNSTTTALSITGVTIDGTNPANFSVTTAPASSIAASASTTMVVQFNATTAGAKTAALHIGSSDASVGAAFDINLTGTGSVAAPTITNVTTNPTVPSNTDTPYVTAAVTPGSGATISGVNLTYSTGAQTTGPAFREVFSNGSTASGLAGAMNAWTTTAVRNATDVKQRGGTGNRTAAVVLTGCATTSGSTTVTCASTTGLIPGMLLTGTNIVSTTTISSVTNSTTFVISQAASATGSALTLTAAGVRLTNCATTNASATVTCDSTAELAVGMGVAISGAGAFTTNPPNSTITSITNSTTFVLNNNVNSATSTGLTLLATGTGLDFSNGTPNLADTMAETTGVLSATAPTAGNVEFYVRNADLLNNNGWTFQISPDGGSTWNTRLSESYASKSVALSNCTLNGTTTVTCASTTGLVTGMTVQGKQVAVTCGTTNASPTVTCANTAGLVVGMFVYGTGITSGTRITAITANTNFTMSANATATNASIGLLANTLVWLTGCGATSTSPTVNCANTTGLAIGMYVAGNGIPNNTTVTAITANTSFTLSANATATGTVPVTGSLLNTNATIATIVNGTSFTLNAAPVYTGSALALDAVSLNHGFPASPYHYDLVAGDMSTNMKMRFQFSGYTSLGPPLRPATVDIDDITVTLTTGAAPVTVQMFDDGLHGDGAAGDGVYGAQLPAFVASTVSYSIAATDSGSQTTTLSSAGGYTTGAAPTITSSATLPNATPNVAYSTTLAATGGSGGNAWSVLSGALPSGLTLSSGGVISGTTSAQGTFNVTIKVTDNAGRIGTKAFTLTVTTATAPNVVIILTDDQGWADVGYHTPAGQVPIQTPNMDSFGTTGIRLEKFYPTTVCSVTRGALLTGRNSLRTSVGNQKGLGLPEHLMPQTFKAAGYQTFMCGKWHIGGWDNNIYTTTMNGATIEVQHEGAEYLPHNRGWDFHKGQYGGAINYFTHTTADPGKNNALDWWQNGVALPNDSIDLQGNGGYSTDLLADKAVEMIQTRDASKPMLLYLAFNAIHAGVSAPQSYLNKYAALGVATPRRTICAAVDCMDVAMGRVLTALDTAGITNNTLVIYMSDNGGENSSGALNSPLRGTKSDSYDGGLHTPAGIRWPGRLAAGVTSNQYIWVGDMFPTICAAVGVTPQNTKPFDGVNLWPALQSITPAAPDGAPRGVPLVTGDNGGPVALNLFTDPVNGGTKMFKLIRNPGTTVVNELFNLTDDPYETTDILLGANAAAHSSIVTTLTSAITGIVTESYPPNFGISGITQTVVAGSSITLYAPFTAYKVAPTVQWKKGGTNVTSSTPFYQVTNSTGGNVAGVYMATLPLTNVTAADAGSYTATASNSNGNATTPAGTLTVVTAPVLNALPAYTSGTSRSITWSAVTGATGYTVQIATNAGFTAGLSSQNVATNTATFTGLTSGTLYYYRATSNYNAASTPYSNTVSSTQDAANPLVAITSSAGSTTRSSLPISGTASDSASGLASVTVNGVTATITSGTWTATVPLNLGSNTLTATATDNVGNTATASITITRNASTQNDGLPDSWKVANNIPLTNDPANGPTGDIDKDGRFNLLEYAFNTNPQSNDADPFQGVAVTKTGDGLKYLEVSCPRRIGALDLLYTVEISDDLTTWPSPGTSTEPVSIVPNGDGITETVTVRVLPAMTSATKKFVRVRVTAQ